MKIDFSKKEIRFLLDYLGFTEKQVDDFIKKYPLREHNDIQSQIIKKLEKCRKEFK